MNVRSTPGPAQQSAGRNPEADTPITVDELLEHLDSAEQSTFRLETRQYYAGYDERVRAYHAGQPLPDNPYRADTLQALRAATVAGRRVERVHVVDLPLSDYVRYELHIYQENADAGEDISLVDRADHPDLASLREDFVLLDADAGNARVIWYDYDQNGHLTGYRLDTRPDTIARAVAVRNLVVTHATALHAWTGHGGMSQE